MAKIRTLNFLPEIFQTPVNAEFLAATLDQLVNESNTVKVQGFVGSRLGYGVNALDYYVTEPTKARTDYQLEPGVVFTKTNESVAQDFISYPGIIDGLKLKGALTENNNNLFNSQFYSWDSFTDLDKLVNYSEYYWLPNGPPAVSVAESPLYDITDYIVTNNPNTYNIEGVNVPDVITTVNPSLTLLRGGTYTFNVNQDSGFYIQTESGISGYSITQPNISTREVFGVINNGADTGTVTFNVPLKNDQDFFNFPGDNRVDVVTSIPFDEINGKLLRSFGDPYTGQLVEGVNDIDGITDLEGLRIMFYNTGDNNLGYVSSYYDEMFYDTNDTELTETRTLEVSNTNSVGNVITLSSGSTSDLIINQTVTFQNPVFGGIVGGQVYFVKNIVNGTDFTISETLEGLEVSLTTGSGSMNMNINLGQYEDGFYTNVNDYYYRVQYVGDSSNPVIRLIPDGLIPVEQKITAIYGTEFIGRSFYKSMLGVINLIPVITADLDVLYYQDASNINKTGTIRLVDSNVDNFINVERDILGQVSYTAPNGVTFTNGLKVTFDSDTFPVSYEQGDYYVEGVGTSIELIPVNELLIPELFTTGEYNPYDMENFDTTTYDITLNLVKDPDYITIARNSINRNAWSRSNRWFHIDVINKTAQYNNDSTILTEYATLENKAKRPIIEFYPNLKLFNSGATGKLPVDFIDTRETDALSNIAGSLNYYPDVEVYTSNTANIASTLTSPVNSASMIVGKSYVITTVGNTDWNSVADTLSATYQIGDIIICKNVESGTGQAILLATSTTITIPASSITGTFQVGMYVGDNNNVLPTNTQITSITETAPNIVLNVSWPTPENVLATTTSIVGTDTTVNNYNLFTGARIIFANDSNVDVRNKIYIVDYVSLTPGSEPKIVLIPAEDSEPTYLNQTVVYRGYNNRGNSFYYDGAEWVLSQQKTLVNQAPLFDVFDENGISFGDTTVYSSSTFIGSKLFNYSVGIGTDDLVLGFPIKYSAVNNIGDISFDVSLNTDTFDYIEGVNPKTLKVNTGYVYNYDQTGNYNRMLGWQTAVAPSVQYQVFNYSFDIDNPTNTYICDIPALTDLSVGEPGWQRVQVLYNNVYQETNNYTYNVVGNATVVTLNNLPTETTIVQVLVLSDQVSNSAYYSIPVNLSNNPLNQNLESVDLGDVRMQYMDMFINAPNTNGDVFGINNTRDLGNIVPYGTKIIQNSASLVLPGVFNRKQQYNIVDALLFNSREYVKYKQLLIDTVKNTDYVQRYTPSEILDDAIDQITSAKSQINAFFWTDMVPSKTAFRVNSYTFNSQLDVTKYPLSKVYNFTSSNYDSVLVYVSRIFNGNRVEKQLTRGLDYYVETDSPTVVVTMDVEIGDVVTVKEYNQTYGSYVPYTPTKLGLYNAYEPKVIYDETYITPTYFILGHDGSYNKLYGDYISETDTLIDFRDQALLEFEKRIYNNIKLSSNEPVLKAYDIEPGYFRTTSYTWDQWLQLYSPNFLNWVGQNRVDYKTQFYNKTKPFTYNYENSGFKLDRSPIKQGYYRGVYQYLYDTATPNMTPWEMLGFSNMPGWWTSRYGPAPYTSENLILWQDLEAGYVYNDGNSYIIPELARPGLTQIIPVDSKGDLLAPLDIVVGNYTNTTFQKDWKVGDMSPVEYSYRRSSTYPFDLVKIFALTEPAKFYNLAVDLDNYVYNSEFNQYLVNNRSHLVIKDVPIYGNGTSATSYVNWIVDYAKQSGVDATTEISTLLDNLDVRLVYRLAGYSDKTLLNFYVEKDSPNSSNAALLIPDESYSILLYDNIPHENLVFSSVVIQKNQGYWTVYGNSQNFAYFPTYLPINNGKTDTITVLNQTVKVAKDYTNTLQLVPYGTKIYSTQEIAQFLMNYSAYLQDKGMQFDVIENGVELNWNLMIQEFLYWVQTGWENNSVITLNPAATDIVIDKEDSIVQPLTLSNQNFVLNQNLYPINLSDICVTRDGNIFKVHTVNEGDSLSYAQFNLGNFEHGVVFDNTTLFNDIVYNLITGLRQNRIYLRGSKSAEWNGTVDASGFILNQDNIREWSKDVRYPKGMIVKYKNRYYTALGLVEPSVIFNEQLWKNIDYNNIQKGMLPNSATRSYESTLYYNINKANLELDADLLSFSLIGYRPREYMTLADLTDITQVNVYKNLIKNKGTRNATYAFKGANLPQGGIEYEVYENWAIKTNDYGGVLNENFVEFKLDQNKLIGNPSIVSLTNGIYTSGSMQEVPITSLFNYGQNVSDPNILNTTTSIQSQLLYPSAGYVNYNDVRMSSFYYGGLSTAVNSAGIIVPINDFYVRDYLWLANFKEKWGVFAWKPIGQVTTVSVNGNNTSTVTFNKPHNLKKFDPVAIVNFASNVDGYYLVEDVINLNQIIINLSVINSVVGDTITGNGIGMAVVSQRVDKPSDISTIDLLETEFTKNTVWVDENKDGSWAVYRKSLNYSKVEDVVVDNSTDFGTGVAFDPVVGYLVSDPGSSTVYRYNFNTENELELIQTITEQTSFGTTIVHKDNLYVMTEPTSVSPNVHLYVYNTDTTATKNLVSYQSISSPIGVTEWAHDVALSDDLNWLYVSSITNTKIYVYRRKNEETVAGSLITGNAYIITELGDTNWKAAGAVDNKVGIIFKALNDGSATISGGSPGTANNISYEEVAVIDGSTLGLTSTDKFGYSITTNNSGSMLVVGTPDKESSSNITNWGTSYLLNRLVQNIEVQSDSIPNITTTYQLSWVPSNTNDVTVLINGILLNSTDYSISAGNLVISTNVFAGDIITVNSIVFALNQTFTSSRSDRINFQFGYAMDSNRYMSELLIGSPYEIDENNNEGMVYRFTNLGAKFGTVLGNNECNVTNTRTLFINNYPVNITSGNAQHVSSLINSAGITNVQSSYTTDNRLIIELINKSIADINEKLLISATSVDTLAELGIEVYKQTQIISNPHAGVSQFGKSISINDYNSVLIGAPVGTRYMSTTFDFTDDENAHNDTVIDNNGTRFVDSFINAGTAFMFDLLDDYNSNILNPGKYVYAQPIYSNTIDYTLSPKFGHAVDLGTTGAIVGSPSFEQVTLGGQASVYINEYGNRDWNEYRQSSSIVDVSKIQNAQIFSESTNQTLVNLDYIDPLQGKLLGSARENIDYVSAIDPARYTVSANIQSTGSAWGEEQIGRLWFDTSRVRFVNYHQNDNVYNSEYWGTLFPGSDVAVYTWVSSNVIPSSYQGPGTPLDINSYSIGSTLNASNIAVPVYYFWARNTNIIVEKLGKTLADSTVAEYIANPRSSGISYMAPLLPNMFALYNSGSYFNSDDSVLHIGYATGNSTDVSHVEYALIRENFVDDFLPGLPPITPAAHTLGLHGAYSATSTQEPKSLYAKMLDSLAGCTLSGELVPNPYLPKSVQSGVLFNPSQSFFYDRLNAVKNYLQFANEVLIQFPITEIRPDITLLQTTGEFFNTTDYWSYVNWWAPGYDDSVRTTIQVPVYADLLAFTPPNKTLAKVEENGYGFYEVYEYNNGVWNRVGLENGTIQFSNYLWDYEAGNIGFDGDFYGTTPFDQYPSEETRYIVRALNEQIYTQELAIYRIKSLILLFEFIQSETIESQNYLPWLNKTSLLDVVHDIRELKEYETFRSDNVDFLEGYINEVKPYHVVIKEFLLKYTGQDVYEGDITDFDLPATYNTTYKTFISPELVYDSSTNINQYELDSNIWDNDFYTQWFSNRGISITGENNIPITTLKSYVSTGSSILEVDNANGFPVNGVITLGEEKISYSYVDRALNVLGGLIRGYDETAISAYEPGTPVNIDLPPVVILDGGNQYNRIPKVTAVIDETKYPAPIEPAILEAVMNNDSIIEITVINPGKGYAVLPEIVIEPSNIIYFGDSSIDSTLNIINVYAPTLKTGDIMQFRSGTNGVKPSKLVDRNWYYVNVLETTPSITIALYSSYSEAINDTNRIQIAANGVSNDMSLAQGARAIAITSSYPVRSNKITMRYDRTSYTSQIVDWLPGNYYGSFFAGEYNNSEKVSSSDILLDSEIPDISTIYASSQGAVFEVVEVENENQLNWTSLARYVYKTVASNNSIQLISQNNEELSETNINSSGSTLGFYKNLPIKFTGSMLGGIIADKTYYVSEILDEISFTISETIDGPVLTLVNDFAVNNNTQCIVSEPTNTAIVTINYPGIRTVTNTTGTINSLTIPLSQIGTNGTTGMYTELPVFFTGNVFGGIIENLPYYITTVIDSETFTISETKTPISATITNTTTSTNVVTLDSTNGFSVNDPIIFTEFTGTLATSNIVEGTLYYVREIISDTQLTISELINGPAFTLLTTTGTGSTTNQKDTVQLTTGAGTMTVNLGLPVSPGQIDGQLFNFYQTSGQYPDISVTTYGDLINKTITATLTTVNRIAFNINTADTTYFYKNMPIRVSDPIGNLNSSTTYYVIEYTGMPDPSNPGEFIPNIQVTVTNTNSVGNILTCSSTDSLYENMPIEFSGQVFGNLVAQQRYFVKNIISPTTFTISETLGGVAFDLTNAIGSTIGIGDPYIKVSTSINGPAIALTDEISSGQFFIQYITSSPVFDVSYILGGYRALVSTSGSGFAVANTMTIPGTLVGGTSPKNDVKLQVNTIGSNGEILDVICSGTVPSNKQQYYGKVLSPTTLALYYDKLLTVPVTGIDFGFTGYVSTTVTNLATSGSLITVTDSTNFSLNDQVVFTGNVLGNIDLGKTYYIKTIPSLTTVTISETPGGSVFDPGNASGTFTMAKPGSYMFLPEPFYFNQSIVRYNNRVYACVVSNNDTEFVLGKWELLDAGDQRLNALDRAAGFYQPTVNMPGYDLTQLFDGITFPDAIYQGNNFQPSEQYDVDVSLKDEPFYPAEVNSVGIVFDGTEYRVASNLLNYSAILNNTSTNTWDVNVLTNNNINLTDLVYNGTYYVITSTNSATPILKSMDGVTWSSTGYYIPYNSLISKTITAAAMSLNSVAYNNGHWVVAGDNILYSTDLYNWEQVTNFLPINEQRLYKVSDVSTLGLVGFIAVGEKKILDTSLSNMMFKVNSIAYSTDGQTWNESNPFTTDTLKSVYSNGTMVVAVGENSVIYYSLNGNDWLGTHQVKCVSVNTSTNQLNVSNTSGFSVGDTVTFNHSFSSIYAGDPYYIYSIDSSTQLTLSDQPSSEPGQSVLPLIDGSIPNLTNMTYYSIAPLPTLNDVVHGNGIWITVGDDGTIKTSSDAIIWTTQTSNTTENLNSIVYNDDDQSFTVVGSTNTIIKSVDNGVTWENISLLSRPAPEFDVQGAPFTYGYGPEELIPGLITDRLTMLVNTRPGTDWPVVEYGHTGFDATSIIHTPSSPSQTIYSFANLVEVPARVILQIIDCDTTSSTFGLGTTLSPTEYTVDWVNKTITLDSPLPYFPTKDQLRIDVYEVGNGSQLVKSNTDSDAIRINSSTGFNEIYVNCAYSQALSLGSGVVRTGSTSITVDVTATDSVTDSITCESVSDFVVNSPFTLQGSSFGLLAEDTIYYVKTINTANNSITVSLSQVGGIAGPTLELTTASGSMNAIIESGNGDVWTDPIVIHNGSRLVLGINGLVSKTSSSNNAITTTSTVGILPNDPIVFCQCMFGEDITPFTVYYVKDIIDDNEFTISSTPGGPVLVLQDESGQSMFITNDYSFGVQPNDVSATIVFATNSYTNSTDYIVYSLFGENEPEQYGYSIPEVEYFDGDGSETEFTLTNFVGYDNPTNAVVEIDGLRQSTSSYIINSLTNTITFNDAPLNDTKIAVLTYNDTRQQYLNTQNGMLAAACSTLVDVVIGSTSSTNDQLTLSSGDTSSFNVNDTIKFNSPVIGGIVAEKFYFVSEINSLTEFKISETMGGSPVLLTTDTGTMDGKVKKLSVAPITSINNNISSPISVGIVTDTTVTSNEITVGTPYNTDNFIVNQTIIFTGTGFGGINTDGTVYFVDSVIDSTTFTIKDSAGNQVNLTTASGTMAFTIGGNPSTRITTSTEHCLKENDVVRIDGVLGSVELNGNTYYAKIITPYIFDLYTEPYNPAQGEYNYPVTGVSSYISGGYAWVSGLFRLISNFVSETNTTGDLITLDTTNNLLVGTPVYFSEPKKFNGDTLLGGLVQGQVYYIASINGNNITVSNERYGDPVALTSETGYVYMTQWLQEDVDRLWVTVNGYRVPSTNLRLYDYNELGILSKVEPGDEVIITNMIPSSTPDQQTYMNIVNKDGIGLVYNSNINSRTWIAEPVYDLSTTISVNDVSKLTTITSTNAIAPAITNGYYNIGITANKRTLCSVSVFNIAKGIEIDSQYITVNIVNTAPVLFIEPGSYIDVNDSLLVTTLEGNTIYVNGEEIKFTTVDFATNTLGGITRGVNGTITNIVIPEYSEVFGLIDRYKLNDSYYDQTWNSYVYNTTDGDPLQISNTEPALFLTRET